MTAKAFALVCLLFVVASCFNSVDAKSVEAKSVRSRRYSCIRSRYRCYWRSGWWGWRYWYCGYFYYYSSCGWFWGKRSVSDDIDDDGLDECLPSKTSAFDCNKDGKISYHEYTTGLLLDEYNQTTRDSFEDGDKNGDGYWSADELRNHPAAKERSDCLQKQHRQRRPFPNQLPGNFEVYDTDKNGLIDWGEFVEQLIRVEKGCTQLKMYRQVMKKIARCDGEVDREDFDRAVSVTTPWLFQPGDGEEGKEQQRLATKEEEEAKAEAEADGEDETEPAEDDERGEDDGVERDANDDGERDEVPRKGARE